MIFPQKQEELVAVAEQDFGVEVVTPAAEAVFRGGRMSLYLEVLYFLL